MALRRLGSAVRSLRAGTAVCKTPVAGKLVLDGCEMATTMCSPAAQSPVQSARSYAKQAKKASMFRPSEHVVCFKRFVWLTCAGSVSSRPTPTLFLCHQFMMHMACTGTSGYSVYRHKPCIQ